MCHTAQIEALSIHSGRRRRVIAAGATLFASMAVVIVAVAGTWALLYQPLFDPNPNGESHVYFAGREMTKFESYATPGVFAALISCFAIQLARPLNRFRKKVVAASTGPTVLLLAAFGFLLLYSAQGFSLSFLTWAAPFMTVVITAAIASSAGFLAAIELARRVWLHAGD